MPKGITTLTEFKEWANSFVKSGQELEIRMKRRGHNAYSFSAENKEETLAHYLIEDGASTGRAYVKNFNRCFRFFLGIYGGMEWKFQKYNHWKE